MADLHIILKNKIDAISRFENKLIALNTTAKNKLDKNLIPKLPSFSGEISEVNITQYLSELGKAIKNPIIHKRKKDIESLGISISTISDVVFENDIIERVYKELSNIRDINKRVFEYFISAFPNEIRNADEFVERLTYHKTFVKELTILEELKSNNLKDTILKKYFSDLIDFQDLKREVDKIVNIEREFNLQIISDNQTQKLDSILQNKSKLVNYGIRFTQKYTSVNELDSTLNNEILKAETEYNLLISQLRFWRNFTRTFYADTKNIQELKNNIAEIKSSLKKDEHEIFPYIEILYSYRYQITDYKNTIDNLKTIANRIEKLDLTEKNSINTINEIANNINQLNSLKLNRTKNTKFKSEAEFIKFYKNAIKKFQQRKEKLYGFLRLTKEPEIEIADNEQLTILLKETETKLQTELGKEYNKIIDFLNNEEKEISNIDIDTLKKFIIYVKPILKDALNYD